MTQNKKTVKRFIKSIPILNGGLQVPYSQHFILFIKNEWFQKARVFVSGKPLQSSVM
jgi:hypothetical protein